MIPRELLDPEADEDGRQYPPWSEIVRLVAAIEALDGVPVITGPVEIITLPPRADDTP